MGLEMNMRDFKIAINAVGCTVIKFGDEYQIYLNEYAKQSKKVIDKVSYFTDDRQDALKTATKMRLDHSVRFGTGKDTKFFMNRVLTAKPDKTNIKTKSPRSIWPEYKQGLNERYFPKLK